MHGLGKEDALQHLMNYVWPNVFETASHLVQATFDAISGFRVSLGPGIMLQYVLQGLFHPARRVSTCLHTDRITTQVREVYWRIFNSVYIGHNDALVAFYPDLEADSPENEYSRPELLMCL